MKAFLKSCHILNNYFYQMPQMCSTVIPSNVLVASWHAELPTRSIRQAQLHYITDCVGCSCYGSEPISCRMKSKSTCSDWLQTKTYNHRFKWKCQYLVLGCCSQSLKGTEYNT